MVGPPPPPSCAAPPPRRDPTERERMWVTVRHNFSLVARYADVSIIVTDHTSTLNDMIIHKRQFDNNSAEINWSQKFSRWVSWHLVQQLQCSIDQGGFVKISVKSWNEVTVSYQTNPCKSLALVWMTIGSMLNFAKFSMKSLQDRKADPPKANYNLHYLTKI